MSSGPTSTVAPVPVPSGTAPLDVMAVLADLQQQLTDLTGIVRAQQGTLRHLLNGPDLDAPAGGTGTTHPDLRRR